MEENIHPFKKAAALLLLLGLIDIAVMIFCIINQTNYASSFTIFGVISGVLLLRGSLKTVQTLRWLSIFISVLIVGISFDTLFTTPPALLIALMKFSPLTVIGPICVAALLVAVFIWIYCQLSSQESLQLLVKANYKATQPKSAYLLGVIGLLVTFLGASEMVNGESAKKAIKLAQTQRGSAYQYHVTRLYVSQNSGYADVIAYSDKAVHQLNVNW
ncbi:hypothetical protein [Shewanella sp. WPAGA9]|uniref:hypothetical protein n=1 Tax=Shewanella sp. ENK2 TaxID=2775245 RepID=UPI0017805D15|nr:hypothetical protein [Shewanella sp. WPAGA9]